MAWFCKKISGVQIALLKHNRRTAAIQNLMSIILPTHVILGELSAFAFLWIFVEYLNPTKERIHRSTFVSLASLIFILTSWVTGAIYYLTKYGSDVKPIIKAGPAPWAHLVFMEAKEHIFLFLPFLIVFGWVCIQFHANEKNFSKVEKDKNSLLQLSAMIFFVAISLAGMGYVISLGFRSALELGVSS
jgi:hypothetical protein